MNARLISAVSAMIFLAGCATTKGPSPVDQLQIKVSQLEGQIAQRDQQVQELRDQLDTLSDRLENERRERSVIPVVAVPSAPPVVTQESDDKEVEILRVDVSAVDVQRALKNAGYYSGPIDGKLGNKSKQAIEAFQKDRNLEADGIIGKRTWAELKKVSEKKSSDN